MRRRSPPAVRRRRRPGRWSPASRSRVSGSWPWAPRGRAGVSDRCFFPWASPSSCWSPASAPCSPFRPATMPPGASGRGSRSGPRWCCTAWACCRWWRCRWRTRSRSGEPRSTRRTSNGSARRGLARKPDAGTRRERALPAADGTASPRGRAADRGHRPALRGHRRGHLGPGQPPPPPGPRPFPWPPGRGGVGVWTLAIATMAATLSGFTFIGGPGLVYSIGLGAMFIILPASLTHTMCAWALAKRMRLLGEARGLLTVPDAIGARYRSPAAQGLAGVAILVAIIGYMATNFLALGLVVGAIFGTGLGAGIWIGSAVVLAYSAAGGMLAGVYTDVFQGGVMALASVLVFRYALEHIG